MFSHGVPDSFHSASQAVDLNKIYVGLMDALSKFDCEKSQIFNRMGIKIKINNGNCAIDLHGYQIVTRLSHSFDKQRHMFWGNVRFIVLDDNGKLAETVCTLTYDCDGNVDVNDYFPRALYLFNATADRNSSNIMLGVVAAVHQKCCTKPDDDQS